MRERLKTQTQEKHALQGKKDKKNISQDSITGESEMIGE